MAAKFCAVAPVVCGPPCGTCFMRSALFCDFTPRRLVVSYRRFGTTYPARLQGWPVFKGEDPFTLEDGAYRFSQIASKELPFDAA